MLLAATDHNWDVFVVQLHDLLLLSGVAFIALNVDAALKCGSEQVLRVRLVTGLCMCIIARKFSIIDVLPRISFPGNLVRIEVCLRTRLKAEFVLRIPDRRHFKQIRGDFTLKRQVLWLPGVWFCLHADYLLLQFLLKLWLWLHQFIDPLPVVFEFSAEAFRNFDFGRRRRRNHGSSLRHWQLYKVAVHLLLHALMDQLRSCVDFLVVELFEHKRAVLKVMRLDLVALWLEAWLADGMVASVLGTCHTSAECVVVSLLSSSCERSD